ncbi:MAG: chemotaxis protein CheC [Bacillota bacterium]
MSEEYAKLDTIHLDALREVGNIGAGNAATVFSQLLGKKVTMTVPNVYILPLNKVAEVIGGADHLIVGIYLKVFGDAPGNILFTFSQESAGFLSEILTKKTSYSSAALTEEMQKSALQEFGNILTSAYLNALSTFTNLIMLPSVPALARDMAGAILDIVLIRLGQAGDYALVIETTFNAEGNQINGHFFLIPEPGSLSMLLKAVGVET